MLCRTTQLPCVHWQLRSYQELKHNYFYWTLLQRFINPFLRVAHIGNRLHSKVWSHYLQYSMCFPFADTHGKETVAQQQMIISIGFPPSLLPPLFWRHRAGAVKQFWITWPCHSLVINPQPCRVLWNQILDASAFLLCVRVAFWTNLY